MEQNELRYEIPVLFVFFNRPEIAAKSFQILREIKPQKIYLACDGPRSNISSESDSVEKARKIILESIDWECEIHQKFEQNNLGCAQGVYSAIEWMFSFEKYGIILEDDCITNKSFFYYVSRMLKKYEYDSRIGMVAGHVFTEKFNITSSYGFSRYYACWGWATWKRAWDNMDFKMEWRSHSNANDILYNRGWGYNERNHWLFQLKEIDNKHVSAWDWQWYFSLARANQLCIFPRVNLVTNVGSDKNATHTSFSDIFVQSFELERNFKEPDSICPSYIIDKEFNKSANTLKSRVLRLIPYGFKKIIKNILKSFL